ncbi:unnamed protein product [Effrenium voratum]|nr:unnamed protein product [Effrenium voratum]
MKQMKQCAHPQCDFRVTQAKMGGFCCKRCHATHVRGEAPAHGEKCNKVSGRGLPRADPAPPSAPLSQSTSKKAMVLAKRAGRTEDLEAAMAKAATPQSDQDSSWKWEEEPQDWPQNQSEEVEENWGNRTGGTRPHEHAEAEPEPTENPEPAQAQGSNDCQPGAKRTLSGTVEALMKRRRVERLDWRKCWVEIEKEVKIHCSGWELCDEDVDNWLLWMRLQPRVTIHELDFSNNSLTSVALGRMCEFLDGCGTHCEQWCFSGNKICDDGFRQLSEHIARGRPAQSVRFDSNPISLHGLIWFLATISLHPQYPAEHQVWGGQRRFRPLWVSLRNTNVVQEDLDDFLASSRFRVLAISVCMASCKVTCQTSSTKHNMIVHLDCGQVAQHHRGYSRGSLAGASSGIFQQPEPSNWRGLWLNPEGQKLRDEPSFVYEDGHFVVLMKPAGWHCTNHGANLLNESRNWTSEQRKSWVQKLCSMRASAALQDYLILRFGADPVFEEVMTAEHLFGMLHRLDVGTSGCLLVAKSEEAFRWAKQLQAQQGFLRNYVALVYGSLREKGLPPRGTISAKIDKSGYTRTRRCEIRAWGVPSFTQYEQLAEFQTPQGRYTLLHLRLLTGRTHQIRVHCEHVGLPLVGDQQYQRHRPQWRDAASACPRTFLHKVRFVFPSWNGEPVVVWTPLACAKDLVEVLRRMTVVDSSLISVRAEDLDQLFTGRAGDG